MDEKKKKRTWLHPDDRDFIAIVLWTWAVDLTGLILLLLAASASGDTIDGARLTVINAPIARSRLGLSNDWIIALGTNSVRIAAGANVTVTTNVTASNVVYTIAATGGSGGGIPEFNGTGTNTTLWFAVVRQPLLISATNSGAFTNTGNLGVGGNFQVAGQAAFYDIATAFSTFSVFGELHVFDRALYSGFASETWGSGSPEGVVTANVGSNYRCTNCSGNTAWYLKTNGTGNTGWWLLR
jgi:hypothetical protein